MHRGTNLFDLARAIPLRSCACNEEERVDGSRTETTPSEKAATAAARLRPAVAHAHTSATHAQSSQRSRHGGAPMSQLSYLPSPPSSSPPSHHRIRRMPPPQPPPKLRPPPPACASTRALSSAALRASVRCFSAASLPFSTSSLPENMFWSARFALSRSPPPPPPPPPLAWMRRGVVECGGQMKRDFGASRRTWQALCT